MGRRETPWDAVGRCLTLRRRLIGGDNPDEALRPGACRMPPSGRGPLEEVMQHAMYGDDNTKCMVLL